MPRQKHAFVPGVVLRAEFPGAVLSNDTGTACRTNPGGTNGLDVSNEARQSETLHLPQAFVDPRAARASGLAPHEGGLSCAYPPLGLHANDGVARRYPIGPRGQDRMVPDLGALRS